MRLLLASLFVPVLLAQSPNPVQWTLTAEAAKAEPGTPVRFKLAAAIEPGWHLYSITSPLTATATKITSEAVKIEKLYQQKAEAKYDAVAGATTESYETSAVFYIDGTLTTASKDLNLIVRSSACNDKVCLPPKRRTIETTLTLAEPTAIPAGIVEAKATAAVPAPATPAAPAKEDLSSFLLVAFGLGLAAIFTPCVFPMIPFTLSYFIGNKGSFAQAVVFCLGIVGLFTAMGVILSAALGPFAVVQLAANPWVNLTISAVFFAFALSMLGAFEIMLPSSLLTKLNQASEGGGYIGALLMGLTFSLTSFACVGPFVGTLLAASVQGDKLQPILGMAAFSSGLATPFFVLALFPAWLQKLPRSGVWMMRVKVVMAFFILAAMLKYLSNVDSVWQLNILTRERFLAGWMVLFAAPAAYLLGWLRLEGIKADQDVTIPRVLLSTFLLAFSLSLFPGMMGNSLGDIDAYVPLSSKATTVFMKNDLPGALAKAKAEGKMVFVNFTGYACTNCHWMKANMFPRPEIAAAMSKYVLVELYTDGTDAASEANQKIQEDRFKTAAIPYYVILDADEKTVRSFPGLTKDPAEFLKFLSL